MEALELRLTKVRAVYSADGSEYKPKDREFEKQMQQIHGFARQNLGLQRFTEPNFHNKL